MSCARGWRYNVTWKYVVEWRIQMGMCGQSRRNNNNRYHTHSLSSQHTVFIYKRHHIHAIFSTAPVVTSTGTLKIHNQATPDRHSDRSQDEDQEPGHTEDGSPHVHGGGIRLYGLCLWHFLKTNSFQISVSPRLLPPHQPHLTPPHFNSHTSTLFFSFYIFLCECQVT